MLIATLVVASIGLLAALAALAKASSFSARIAEAERPQAVGELAGRLAGEGQREDVAGVEVAGGGPPGDAAREHARLARPGAGEDAQRRHGGGDGRALRAVASFEQGVGVHTGDRTHLR